MTGMGRSLSQTRWFEFTSRFYRWRWSTAHAVRRAQHPYDWERLKTPLRNYWLRDPVTGVIRDESDPAMAQELTTSWDGRRWHIAHLPWRWRGRPEKEQWDDGRWAQLDAVIAARARAAAPTKTDPSTNVALDEERRMMLDGATLRGLPPAASQAPLHIRAENAVFVGPCRSQWFGPGAWFRNAQFWGRADFTDARFEGSTCFNGAVFRGQVCFDRAEFQDYAQFKRALVCGTSSFHRTVFNGLARLSSVRLLRPGDFRHAQFVRGVRLSGAHFLADITFADAKFPEGAFVRRAQFGGGVSFKNCAFGDGASFRLARFAGLPEFEHATLRADSTFDRAHFSVVQRIAHPALVINLLLAGVGGALAPFAGWAAALPWAVWTFAGGALLRRQTDLERLSGAFRCLGEHARRFNNRADVGRFLLQELRTSRLRMDLNPVERILSFLFDVTSQYGYSLTRPIIGLIAAVFVFAGVYASWDRGAVTPIARMTPTKAGVVLDAEALEFSLRNTLAPLSVWATDPVARHCDLRARLLTATTIASEGPKPKGSVRCLPPVLRNKPADSLPLHLLALRLVASLQSLIGVFMIFAAGLALKRRFATNP